MTNAKALDEPVQSCVVMMILVIQMCPEAVVVKVYIGYAGCVLFRLRVWFTVSHGASRKPLELHDVLGQSARLIREDIADHA